MRAFAYIPLVSAALAVSSAPAESTSQATAVLEEALSCKPDQSPNACAALNEAATSALPVIIPLPVVTPDDDDADSMRVASRSSHTDAEIIAAFRRVADQLNMGRRVEAHYSNEDILRAVNTYKAEHGEELDLAGRHFFMLVWGIVRRFFDGLFNIGDGH